MSKYKAILAFFSLAISLFLASGCDLVHRHMRDQPRYDPLEESAFFADGRAARPLPANTIPRGEWGQVKLDEHLYTGRVDGELATDFPFPITAEVLKRGQERYNIFCSPCHSRVGDGQGMIVQRGFVQPPSFHTERLRNEPVGHYYDVISNGFGVMYSYAARIEPNDRWAIVAYIRALQYSQHAPFESLPPADQAELNGQ